ncbi:hypothetical protein ACO2Q8_21580 [Larkinella sp. VNQ87]|uniref:hypothetical protein n=1 Tax=Larkinella sp. VNQ87 TaxID=3400921 RepID=UPI003C0C44B3
MKTETEVIGRLLANTRRPKRALSIFEIAEDIDWLSNHLGSLSAAAALLSLSTSMLNQFLRVHKLSPKAQTLVKNRAIDSVSVVHNLAKFSNADQDVIVDQIKEGQLAYADLRLLNPLRKQLPNEPIETLIRKLQDSKNIKVSVVQFPAESLQRDINELRTELSKITGPSEIVDVVLEDGVGSMKLTPKGEQALRQAARRQHKTLRDFTYALLQ